MTALCLCLPMLFGPPVAELSGYLSAYDETPTLATLAYRQEVGDVPLSLVDYDGLLAVEDCGLIGRDALMIVGGEAFRMMIFDCSGSARTSAWMRDHRIVGEVGWMFSRYRPDAVHAWATVEVR